MLLHPACQLGDEAEPCIVGYLHRRVTSRAHTPGPNGPQGGTHVPFKGTWALGPGDGLARMEAR
jgi:hypothetical protein